MLTTNDPYVLDLWRKDLGDSEIIFLSDGNNEFLNSSKLIRNHEKSFMGQRLMRSIIILENLIIKKLIIDQHGELKKTSYEEILKNI